MNTTDKRNTKKNINWTKLLCIKIDLGVVFFWFVTVVWCSNSRNKQKINTFTEIVRLDWSYLFYVVEHSFPFFIVSSMIRSIFSNCDRNFPFDRFVYFHAVYNSVAYWNFHACHWMHFRVWFTLRIWFSWYDLLLLNTFHWFDQHFLIIYNSTEKSIQHIKLATVYLICCDNCWTGKGISKWFWGQHVFFCRFHFDSYCRSSIEL